MESKTKTPMPVKSEEISKIRNVITVETLKPNSPDSSGFFSMPANNLAVKIATAAQLGSI